MRCRSRLTLTRRQDTPRAIMHSMTSYHRTCSAHQISQLLFCRVRHGATWPAPPGPCHNPLLHPHRVCHTFAVTDTDTQTRRHKNRRSNTNAFFRSVASCVNAFPSTFVVTLSPKAAKEPPQKNAKQDRSEEKLSCVEVTEETALSRAPLVSTPVSSWIEGVPV